MINEWDKDLNKISNKLGEKTREIIDRMIDNGNIKEAINFIDTFYFKYFL